MPCVAACLVVCHTTRRVVARAARLALAQWLAVHWARGVPCIGPKACIARPRCTYLALALLRALHRAGGAHCLVVVARRSPAMCILILYSIMHDVDEEVNMDTKWPLRPLIFYL